MVDLQLGRLRQCCFIVKGTEVASFELEVQLRHGVAQAMFPVTSTDGAASAVWRPWLQSSNSRQMWGPKCQGTTFI